MEKQKKYYYMGKKEAIAFQSMLFAVSEERISNYKEVFGDNCIEYYGYEFPNYVTIEKNGTVREATNYELYKNKIIELPSDLYIDKKDNEVYSKFDKFPIERNFFIKPEWSDDTQDWYESATMDEQIEFRHNEKIEMFDTLLSETDKFELLSYRTFIVDNGDNILEMDNYRKDLISKRYHLKMINTKALRSLNLIQEISQLPERPNWSFKY